MLADVETTATARHDSGCNCAVRVCVARQPVQSSTVIALALVIHYRKIHTKHVNDDCELVKTAIDKEQFKVPL